MPPPRSVGTNSEEYQAALKIRQANSEGRLILVEGAG